MEEQENRTDSRVLVLKTGTIRAGQDKAPVKCAVLNVSASGACLLVPREVLIPDRFELSVDGGGTSHDCRMVWRKGARIGLAFVPRGFVEDHP